MFRPSDAELERWIDAEIQRRLSTDPAYRNAATADEQVEREDEIVTEVTVDYLRRYRTTEWP